MSRMKGLIRARVARTPEDMFDNLSHKEESYYRKQAAKVARILNHKIVQSCMHAVVCWPSQLVGWVKF